MSRAAQTAPAAQEAPAAPAAPLTLDALGEMLDRLDREKPIRVPVVEGRLCPDSLEGYQRLARAYILSDMIPFTFKGTGNNKRNDTQLLACVTLVLAAGMGSLKLTPEQALAGMMVVNNRTALFGDVLPALIRGSGKCLGIDERMVGEGDARTAVCKMTRLHRLPDGTLEREIIERRFSVADAKTAKLWQKRGYEGKDTPWITHPERMLQMRARAFAARDGFADVLMGMGIVEELQDIDPQEPTNGHADKAASAQAAIEALKPAQTAPEAQTQQEPSKGNQRQTTKPQVGQAAAPAGKPDGGDPANHESEADAGNGQEQDPRGVMIDDSGGLGGDESQLTQGTDAEAPTPGVQAAAAHNPTARRTKPPRKSTGDANAQPPEGMLLGNAAPTPQNAKPAPTRPWATK